MNTKRKGTRNERKTRTILTQQGFVCARSAASLGPFDVIAIGPDRVRLVQVRTNRAGDISELQGLRCPSCVTKELWVWRDYVSEPHITFVN